MQNPTHMLNQHFTYVAIICKFCTYLLKIASKWKIVNICPLVCLTRNEKTQNSIKCT